MSNNQLSKNANANASAAVGMELRRQLLQCMAETLTQRQYQAFVLNFLEGMPQKEVARELGISPSAVSRLCLAARYRLRLALGYELESYDYLNDDPIMFPDDPYPVSLPGCVRPATPS